MARTVSTTGHLIRNRNNDPGWVSYLGAGATHTKFIITAPEFLILYIIVNISLPCLFPCFLIIGVLTCIASAHRYKSLRVTYESRLASLATTVCAAVANTEEDELFRQLNASSNTKEFASQHAISLITRHLVSERDNSFHGLAMKLADAEAEASRSSKRMKELSSSLTLLQGESTNNERSRIKVTEVNAEIQELRRGYQVRQTQRTRHATVWVRLIFLWLRA